ncbi:MAG: NAD(P)-dependent oxidoreductase [Clostridia bacterium]|nr:NAD(P)-dependent oxidoreductase [Clostridia bacterium]
MKNIVVFGASGDTGRYFIEYFLENYNGNEYQVVATGTRETDCFDSLGVPYYQVDITNKSDFDKLPSDVYAVLDLAGLMPARMKGYDPYKYIDVNIIGNLNILEYCRKSGADRILFAQSFGDIKDWAEEKLVLTADMPRNFSYTTDHTVYVMCKNFAVDLMENYYQMYGLKRFIFRLPTIYLWSPVDHYYVDGEIRKIGYRILIDKAINGEDIEVWGDASRQKDMVYVKDFCQMLFKALFVNRTCGYYNVGTGVGTSLLEQIKGIAEVFGEEGKKSNLIMRPDKPNAPQYIMDITPAREELGYAPKYDYITMLKDFKKEMEKANSKKA